MPDVSSDDLKQLLCKYMTMHTTCTDVHRLIALIFYNSLMTQKTMILL